MTDLITISNRKIANCEDNIISIIYNEEKLVEDEESIRKFIDDYRKTIEENKNSFVIVDLRKLKKINYEFVWKNMNKVNEIDNFVKDNVKGICYTINSNIVKKLANTVLKVYKPVVTIKICSNNKEVLDFIKNH